MNEEGRHEPRQREGRQRGGANHDVNKMEDEELLSQIEKLDPREEDTTILLEILKFSGRDVNVLEMFQAYKVIMMKDKKVANKRSKYSDDEMREMFTTALF